MKLVAYLTTALVLTAANAHAQNTLSITGQWIGTTKSPSTGNELQIQVAITESKSTWKYFTPSGSRRAPNACFDREFPISVQTLPKEKFALAVDASSVIAGCPSFSLALERTDEQTLSGAFGDGRAIVFKKK